MLSSMMAMVAKIRVGSSMGEPRLRTPKVGGSTPLRSTCIQQVAAAATISDNLDASVAQLEEHPPEERGVPRPNRGAGTAHAVLRSFRVPALRGLICAGVVQLAEQRFRKPQVAGSMPVAGPADPMKGTTGTTTTGSVPEWSKGRGRNPRSLARNIPGSTPGRPTSLTAGGSYCGRVVEMVQAAACKAADVGSSPIAPSEMKDLRGCCGAMVQRNGFPAVYRETRVRLPLAPLPKAADSDTCAPGRHS